MIMIAFKGAIWDFIQYPHSAANCLQHVRPVQVARAQPCANHVQHIERLSRASSCYVSLGTKGQLSY